MKKEGIKITTVDFARLSKLIMLEKDQKSNYYYLQKLQEELKNAQQVEPREIDPEIITMNSVVKFTDLQEKKSSMIKLVYPKDADIKRKFISILAPIGIALLGYKKGDIVEWEVPAGKRAYKIDEVLYQPEANGDYLL